MYRQCRGWFTSWRHPELVQLSWKCSRRYQRCRIPVYSSLLFSASILANQTCSWMWKQAECSCQGWKCCATCHAAQICIFCVILLLSGESCRIMFSASRSRLLVQLSCMTGIPLADPLKDYCYSQFPLWPDLGETPRWSKFLRRKVWPGPSAEIFFGGGGINFGRG